MIWERFLESVCFCTLDGQIKSVSWGRRHSFTIHFLRNNVLNEWVDKANVRLALERDDRGTDIVVVVNIGHNMSDESYF